VGVRERGGGRGVGLRERKPGILSASDQTCVQHGPTPTFEETSSGMTQDSSQFSHPQIQLGNHTPTSATLKQLKACMVSR
jgi:hypothetical protein